MKNVASFEEFVKNGTHPFVKKHYSGEKKGEAGMETLEDPKDSTEKGGGVDHTEKVNAKDLSDPKIQPKKV
jgi:hypothetical protein